MLAQLTIAAAEMRETTGFLDIWRRARDDRASLIAVRAEKAIPCRSIIVKKNCTGATFIRHRKIPQECPINERLVLLSPGLQINCTKSAVLNKFKRRDMNLCQMNVYFLCAVRAAHHAAIDDRKIKVHCKRTIDATFKCTRVDQSVQRILRQVWKHLRYGGIIACIEAYSNKQCRAVSRSQPSTPAESSKPHSVSAMYRMIQH
jgi:hypothetical protein